MPRITDFSIIDTQDKPIMFFYKQVKKEDLQSFLDESFLTLLDYVKKGYVDATDLPFLHIVDDSNNILSVVTGIPIVEAIKDTDTIKCSVLPGSKNIVAYYQGDVSGMDALHKEMKEYALENNYEVIAYPYEYYLNDKRFGTDQLLTKVVLPIIQENELN